MLRDELVVDLVGRHARVDDAAHCIDELGSAAVVERDDEVHDLVATREFERFVHLAQQPLWHPPIAPADESDADTAIVELVSTTDEDRLVEVHQESHFVDRPAPVLGRERIDGEPLDAERERAFDGVEQRFFAGLVALGALEAPLGRPPAIAVHHARNVRGDA